MTRRIVAPSRGRGSKHDPECSEPDHRRRPFTGARIETPSTCRSRSATASRPFTGARIETELETERMTIHAVAPSRGRGSKPPLDRPRDGGHSRPLTGAWMETLAGGIARTNARRRPLSGARIETPALSRWRPAASPPHGGADRNIGDRGERPPDGVAPSRGRGSKLLGRRRGGWFGRRHLTGARIETHR